MMLTELADVCRAADLRVIEVAGWRTRGHGQMTDVRTIICHHTAGPPTGDYPSLRVVRDGRTDLAGPLAHLGLARDGTVYVIAAGLCWHAGQSRDPSYDNAHSIGIEAENSGAQPWPGVQMTAYVTLCRTLADHYRVPYNRVLGHKETCAPVGRKTDPNFDMDMLRARIAAKPKPTVIQEDEDMKADDTMKFRDAYLAQRDGPKAVDQTLTVAQGIQRAYNYGSVALRDLADLSAEVVELRKELAALKGMKA